MELPCKAFISVGVHFAHGLFHNHKFSNNYQRENMYKIVTKTQLVIVV